MTKQLNWREYERETEGVKKAEYLKIPLDQIKVRQGFNPRDLTKPETRGKILAIKEAYKAGRYVDPIKVKLVGEQVEIVDGECRYTAITMAHEELVIAGHPGIASMFCIPFKGNDAEALVHTITANEGERLIPIEVADVVARLINMGWERAKIAESFTYSADWVNKLLFMATLPEKVKQMIKEKKVSTDVAVAAFKKHGESVVDYLEDVTEGETQKVTTKKVREKKPIEKDEKFLNKVLNHAKVAVEDLGFVKEAYPMGINPEEDYEIVLKGATLKELVELQDLIKKRESKSVEQD